MRRRLQRHGNSLVLNFTSDLLLALGLDASSEAEVEIELTAKGLLLRPVGGGPVATQLLPKWASHPATLQLLLAMRDLAPVKTRALAEALGRTQQAVSAAVVRVQKQGATQVSPAGWSLTTEAAAWFAHVPPTSHTAPEPIPGERRTKGSIRDVLLAALTSEPQTSTQVGKAASMDRSQAHNELRAMAADGLIELVDGRPMRWRRA